MATERETELLPCPFCGSKSIHIRDGWICCPIEYEANAYCIDCDSSGPNESRHDTPEEAEAAAITAWNTRAK